MYVRMKKEYYVDNNLLMINSAIVGEVLEENVPSMKNDSSKAEPLKPVVH